MTENAQPGIGEVLRWPGGPALFEVRDPDGRHKLPLRGDLRRSLGKEAGDLVRIHLTERLS